MLIEKRGVIKYPPFISECSFIIGKFRSILAHRIRESANKYDRGAQNEEVDVLGVKGELIFSYFLQSKNIHHELTTLLGYKPITGYDIKVLNKTIDVKTVDAKAKFLLVNEEAHHKSKNVGTYVFIQILDEHKAKYWVFKREDVDKWYVKNFNYTNAYYLSIYNAEELFDQATLEEKKSEKKFEKP